MRRAQIVISAFYKCHLVSNFGLLSAISSAGEPGILETKLMCTDPSNKLFVYNATNLSVGNIYISLYICQIVIVNYVYSTITAVAICVHTRFNGKVAYALKFSLGVIQCAGACYLIGGWGLTLYRAAKSF